MEATTTVHTSADLLAFLDTSPPFDVVLDFIEHLLETPEWVLVELSQSPPSFTIGYVPTHDSHTFLVPMPVVKEREYGRAAERRRARSARRRRRPHGS